MPRATRIASLIWIIGVSAASAQGAPTCAESVDLDPANTIDFARVAPGADKINFIKDSKGGDTCPSAADACKARAFVLPGDLVTIQKAPGDYVCAEYTSAKGVTTAGFLPTAALVAAEPPAVRLESWFGKWRLGDGSAKLDIARGKKPGEVSISGSATYGAQDPVRVKNGSVNFGDFSVTVAPRGPLIEFAVDDDEASPITSTEEFICKIRMEIDGKSLLVEDNGKCGGNNVSFSGPYSRR